MDLTTILLIVIGVIFFLGVSIAGSASKYFLETAEKRKNIIFSGGTTASQLARKCISKNNLDISIAHTKYRYNEHYSSRKKYIAISDDFFDSNSLVANGIIAHEIGHALTDKFHNPTFVFHHFLAKLCRVINYLFYIDVVSYIVIIAAFPDYKNISFALLIAGLVMVGLSILFKLITIKNEKIASETGLAILMEYGATKDEIKNIKTVYNAALITYIGALFMPIIRILNFIFGLIYNTVGRLFR